MKDFFRSFLKSQAKKKLFWETIIILRLSLNFFISFSILSITNLGLTVLAWYPIFLFIIFMVITLFNWKMFQLVESNVQNVTYIKTHCFMDITSDHITCKDLTCLLKWGWSFLIKIISPFKIREYFKILPLKTKWVLNMA